MPFILFYLVYYVLLCIKILKLHRNDDGSQQRYIVDEDFWSFRPDFRTHQWAYWRFPPKRKLSIPPRCKTDDLKYHHPRSPAESSHKYSNRAGK